MRQGYYFRPLIPLLLVFIAGIYMGSEYPGRLTGALLGGGIAAAVVVYGLVRRKPCAFSPLLLIFFVGYLSIQPWTAPRFSDTHVVRFIESGKRDLSGTVMAGIKRGEKRTRFVLEHLFIHDNGKDSEAAFPLAGKLRVSCWGRPPVFYPGDRVSLKARIRPVNSFKNPGGFDYRRYLAFKGIWANAYTSDRMLAVVSRPNALSFSNRIRAFRRAFSRFIDDTLSSRTPETKSVLKALVLGVREEIPADLRNAFHRAGVSHLLAISGLHIGIVAGAAFWLLLQGLSYWRGLLWRAWTRKTAALLSLIPVLGYGLLSGMSPSTQRAVIMVTVFLAAFFFEKEHDPFNTLAVAAMGILLLDPPALFSISFQLSFASVFSILFGMSRTRHWWRHAGKAGEASRFEKMRQWLVSFLLVSAFAVLGTLPLVMVYFNQVSLLSLGSNLVIVPLVGFIAVPVGLLAVCLFPVYLPASILCLKFSAAVIQKAVDAVVFFSQLPFAALKTFTPTSLEIVWFYAVMGLLLDWVARRDRPPVPPAPQRTGKKAIFFMRRQGLRDRRGVAILLLLAVGMTDVGYWLHYRLWHTDLRVSILDVGAGNAVLAELPKGFNLLIDGGGFPDNKTFDIGAYVVAPFLWRQKIRCLDAVVLSHPNSDHMNGLVYILRHFRVKTLWTNGDHENSKSFRDFMKTVHQKKIQIPDFETLPRFFQIHDVAVEIWYPPPEYQAFKERDRWRETNNNSMVLRLRNRGFSFLFPGDIMAKAERELVQTAGEAIQSTVLMAPHHGSQTSSTPGFLRAVKPKYIVVSAGNRGPHSKVLKRYRRFGAAVFSTHVHGAVRLFVDDAGLRLLPTVQDARLLKR